MKNRAAGLLKQIITMLATMAKSKTLALKAKTRALKTRIVIFSLLHHNRKIFITSISHKLSSLVSHNDRRSKLEDEETYPDVETAAGTCSSVVVNNLMSPSPSSSSGKYPDLTHTLFESDTEEFADPGGSVIDLVKSCKEDNGEEFKLEDEIDRVADLFIKRFHRQMRLQKQRSLEDYSDMLERSA